MGVRGAGLRGLGRLARRLGRHRCGWLGRDLRLLPAAGKGKGKDSDAGQADQDRDADDAADHPGRDPSDFSGFGGRSSGCCYLRLTATLQVHKGIPDADDVAFLSLT